jgi:hypothetical protein
LRKDKFEGARDSLGQLCAQGLQDNSITRAMGMAALRISGKNPVPKALRERMSCSALAMPLAPQQRKNMMKRARNSRL